MGQAGSKKRNGYFVVLLLAGVYTLSFLDRQLVALLAEPIKKDLALSDTQLGLLTGLTFAVFYTLFGLPVAWIADRSSRVRVVVISCALWSLFTAACGFAQNFTQIALSRIGVGVGEAGGSPPSLSIIADYFPPEQRGKATAMYALGVPIGTTLGAAVGGWIAAHYGWRSAFMAVGTFGMFYALVIRQGVKEPIRGQFDTGPAQATKSGSVIKRFLLDPALFLTALAAGLSAFVGYAMLSWTPALLMRTKGMSLEQLAVYYSIVSGVTAGIGTLLSGYLVDWLGKRDRRMYVLVPAASFALAAPFFVAAVATPSWQRSLLIMTVPFALYTSYLAPALALVQNSVLPEQRSIASAVLLFVASIIGLGGGPVYVGTISDIAAQAGYHAPLQIAMFALAPVFGLAVLAQLAAARAIRRSNTINA